MHPLSFGFKQFDTGDRAKGPTGWMAAWEFNTSRLNSHQHDGIDSVKLAIVNLATPTSTVTAATWGVDGVGYSATVTVPAAITNISDYEVQFEIPVGFADTGKRLYLQYEKLTGTTFKVHCNDNTIDVLVIYR